MAAKEDTSKEKEKEKEKLDSRPKDSKEKEKEKEKEKLDSGPKDSKEKEKSDGIINGVYKVNLHCPQCAREIKKPLLRTEGIHNVEVDMEKDEIKVKGVFDPIQILKRIQKLSNKKTDLVSPKVQEIKVKDTPKADKNAKETKQEVSRTTTVKVQMHCDKCEKDLKRKLLKRKDIHSVKTDMKAQTLTVNGPIEAEKVINIIRKKVNKHAEIVVAPKIDKKEDKKDNKDKPGVGGSTSKTEKPGVDGSTSKTEKPGVGGSTSKTEKPGVGGGSNSKTENNKEENKEKEKESTSGEGKSSTELITPNKISNDKEEEIYKAVEVKSKDGNYTPYFVHYVYAPQLFSDENPNACTIL